MRVAEEGTRRDGAEHADGNGGAPTVTKSGAINSEKPAVILVDASNVAYGRTSPSSSPTLDNLSKVLEAVARVGYRPITLADATLRHTIDRREDLESLFADGTITQVPAGTSADDFLWRLWRNYQTKGVRAFIITNDQFPTDRARKEGFADSPRVAVLVVGEDVLFQPPLEPIVGGSLPAEVVRSPATVRKSDTVRPNSTHERNQSRPAPGAKGTDSVRDLSRPSTERLVGAAIRVIASLTEPEGGQARRVNFAGVASVLHSEFEGDFVEHFDLHRPKDLARLLSEKGLVTISFENATMYVEPTKTFEDQASALPRLERAARDEHGSGAPGREAAVLGNPQTTQRRPVTPPEVIEVSGGAPPPTVEIGSPELFLRLAHDHKPQHIFHWPSGVYSDEYGSRQRTGGEFFFVAGGTSYRLYGRAYGTLDDYLEARAHGFQGADHRSVIGDKFMDEWYEGKRSPKVWREVQSFRGLEQDDFTPMEGDVFYCARASGFSDLTDFLADRAQKEKERPHYV